MEAKGLGSDVTVCGAFATSQLLLCVTCYLSNSWVGTKAPQLRMEVWDPYLLAVIGLFRTRPIYAQVREGRGGDLGWDLGPQMPVPEKEELGLGAG